MDNLNRSFDRTRNDFVDCSLVSIAAVPAFGILTASARREEGKDLGGLVASEKGCDARGVFHFEFVATLASGSPEGNRYLYFLRRFFSGRSRIFHALVHICE